MFLWGQTPAFDSFVREARGIRSRRWTFDKWYEQLLDLQEELKNNTELVKRMEARAEKLYHGPKLIPYGRFFDMYYYAKAKDNNGDVR